MKERGANPLRVEGEGWMERRILAGASPCRDALHRQGSPDDGADAQPNTRTNRRGLTPLSRFLYDQRAVYPFFCDGVVSAVRLFPACYPNTTTRSASATSISTARTVTAAPIFRMSVPGPVLMALINYQLGAIHNKSDRQLVIVSDYDRYVTQ